MARTIRHRRDTVGDNSIRVHAAIVRDEFGVDITRFGRGQYALHSWLLIIQSKGFVEWPRSEGDRARLPILIGRTLGNTSEGMVQAASVAAESSRSAPLATAHKVKYYFFNGQRVAMERNGVFTYLHGDHLGSTIAETGVVGSDNGKIVNKREYNPYGSRRSGDTQLNTDRTYTGQQSDETGLMYYNARYYDPAIGHFISPDTIVPDPGNVLDYNRYMYVRGSPLKYTDPSGHCPAPSEDSGNVLCIGFFIPKETALNLKGDDRTFDYDSEPEQSRAYLYVDLDQAVSTENTSIIMNPSTRTSGKSFEAYPTNQEGVWGYVKQAFGSGNWFNIETQGEEIVLNYSLNQSANSGFFIAPSIDGEIRLKQDGKGNWLSSGNRDHFPSLEIYSYHSGQLEQIIRRSDAESTALYLNWAFPNENWDYPYDLPSGQDGSGIY